MLVDAVLIGSRYMVAQEVATSLVVKKLIVAAPGLENEAMVCVCARVYGSMGVCGGMDV